MKSSNRILVIFLNICLFASILTFKYLLDGLFSNGQFYFNFSFLSYLGAFFLLATIVLLVVIYIKFLKLQNFGAYIFFVSLPVTLTFVFGMYLLFAFGSGKEAFNLKVLQTNFTFLGNTNAFYWAFAALSVTYILITFLIYFFLTKPIKQVQKATDRLSDGIVKDRIVIKGSKQFKNIEFSLNKINENYKNDARTLKETYSEVEKFIPKEFLRNFGVNNILDLELGNSVQKEVTTLFCDIKNSMAISSTLSLEENFNFINAYLNLIAPLIRRYNGFVDKYLGDGIMAVFQKSEHAFECCKAIFSAVDDKNFKNKALPPIKVEISIHTGEVVFGVVGEENRKSLTILSEGVSLASKLSEVNKFYGTRVVFSKRTLNSLPYGFFINYRYIGTIKRPQENNQPISVFENIDVLPRVKREKILAYKKVFENGVRLYEDGDYVNSKAIFENIVSKYNKDQVAYTYYNLCDEKIKLAED